jgi:transcription initiation factor TFIIIB Brf1 subunit/transcription initiation factor TFIIB
MYSDICVDEVWHGSGFSTTTTIVKREKNILNDLKDVPIPEIVKRKADEIFRNVTKDRTYRSSPRNGLIYGCVFEAYKILGKPQNPKSLSKVLNISNKDISKGSTIMFKSKIREGINTKDLYNTPIDLLPDLFEELGIDICLLPKLKYIYEIIIQRSDIFNRAFPHTIAASLIYYILSIHNISIDIEPFCKKVNSSKITIQSMYKEIKKYID